MRDAIVLPGKIVKALAHEAAVSFEILFGVFVFLAYRHYKCLCLIRSEVGLEDHHVRLFHTMRVSVWLGEPEQLVSHTLTQISCTP